MTTAFQLKALAAALKDHRKKYQKQFNAKDGSEKLDEASTRILVNSFLTDVLGYKELDEIKTEARIKRQFADYLIEVNKKKEIIVEVKPLGATLGAKHLSQVQGYALDAGLEWAILTNGKIYQLYKIILAKPVKEKLLFEFDVSMAPNSNSLEEIWLLSRAARKNKKELLNYWGRLQTSSPEEMSKLLYDEGVVKALRKQMKIKSGINFSDEEIIDSIYDIITKKLESTKPNSPTNNKSK